MSISISKQTDKVRFLTSNTTLVTKVYQQAKQKNSCQAFKNKLLHKRSISELNQSKIEVIPIQTIRNPQELSTTQSASNFLTGSQVNFEPNSEILELKKQLLIRDKKIAQLNAAIHQKTDQIAREKNNSFLTSRLHGKQIVSYEERINDYEKKISELNKSKEGQPSTQNKEMGEQINKLRVSKQRLQKEIQKEKQNIVRQRKQWGDEKQKIIVEHVKQVQGKSREIIGLQMKLNQLSEENRKQREEKEKAIKQVFEFRKRVQSLQQSIKAITIKGSEQQEKLSDRAQQLMQQKQKRYIYMESEYKRVADQMRVIKQQLKKKEQQILLQKQQYRQLIQREKSNNQQKQNKINQLTQIINSKDNESESIRLKQRRIIQLQQLLQTKHQQQQEYTKLKYAYSQIQDKYFQLLEEFNLQLRRIQTQRDKQIKEMRMIISNKDKQIQRINYKQIQRINQKILEQQRIEQRMVQLQQKLLEMQRQIQIKSKFSQQSIEKISQLTKGIEDKQVQINQLKGQMRKMKDENMKLVEENSKLVEQNNKLNSRIKQNNKLNSRIKQEQLQVNSYKEQISNLTSNTQNLNKQIDSLKEQITQLKQQRDKQLINSSKITSSKLNQLSLSLIQKQQQLTQKQEQINQLKTQLNELKTQLNQHIKSNCLLNQSLSQNKLKLQSIQVNLRRAQHLNTLLSNQNKILHEQIDALQHTTLYLKKQLTSTIENHQKSLKQVSLLKQLSQQTKRSKTIKPYPYRQRLSYTARSKYQHDNMRYQHNHIGYQHNPMGYQTDRNNHSPYKEIYHPYQHQYNNTYDNYQNHQNKSSNNHQNKSSNHYQNKVYRSASYIDTDLADRQKRSSKQLDQNFIHNMNLSAVSLDIQLNKKNISFRNNHRRTQTQPIEAIDQEGSEYEHNNKKTICVLHKISGVSSIMLGSDEEKFHLQRDMTRSKDTFHLQRDMTRSKDTFQNMIKPFSCESQHYCEEQSAEVSFSKQE